MWLIVNWQYYLDEFVFRFNRRRTRHAAFHTLLGIGARTAPAPTTHCEARNELPHNM